jgi:hypothetical protein
MKNKVKSEGKSELFKTTNKSTILSLDDKKWYAIASGQKGDMMIKTDSDHEKSKSLKKGKYYHVKFKDDPVFQDMPRLLLKKRTKYEEWLLPNDLPTSKKKRVKLIKQDKKISEEKLKKHIENKETSSDKKSSLKDKSKKELYKLAKKHKIKNRSKMDKKELVKKLKAKI